MKDRTSSTEYRYAEGKPIGSPTLRPSWRVSRLISSWYQDRTLRSGGEECDQDDSHRYGGPGLDPVEGGLVESLARPGGNVTGFTNLGGDLGGKRPELFKDAVPKLDRVAVLYEADLPRNMFEAKEVLPVSASALS